MCDRSDPSQHLPHVAFRIEIDVPVFDLYVAIDPDANLLPRRSAHD
ncbi:hypothetical protein MESS4_70036 [Mesorhizobium sp. STM 4661]|nr:hypothetical protein MESS4_70036 [Mesorhizobium sp. STM 4661]